jgi:hypothetical protein
MLTIKAMSFRAESRNLLLFNRGLRGFHGFSLLNFPRRISSVLLAFKQAPIILVLFGKAKVTTLREAWRLVINLSRSQNGELPMPRSRDAASSNGLKRVPEVELRDLAAEDDAGDA